MKPPINEDDYLRKSTADADSLSLSKQAKHDYETLLKRKNDYREACQYMMSVIGDRKKAAEFLTIAENLDKMLLAI